MVAIHAEGRSRGETEEHVEELRRGGAHAWRIWAQIAESRSF
jgi:hypothetical protein